MVFLGSTSQYTQLNCIKSWDFISTDIHGDEHHFLWLWILLSAILFVLLIGVFFYMYRKCKNKKVVEEDSNVERQIQNSANAPKKFGFKELKHATANFDPKTHAW